MVVLILIAMAGGVLSFLSPCILPIIPVYLSILGGDGAQKDATFRRVLSVVFFIAGFTGVFVAFGASASAVGSLLRQNFSTLSVVAGLGLLILGLHLMGWLRIPFLLRDTRASVTPASGSFLRAGLMGTFLALGWSPCVGPILTAILALGTTSQTLAQGMLLLFAYSMGIGIPLLIVALFSEVILGWTRRFRGGMMVVEKAMGALVIGVALLMLSGKVSLLTRFGGGAEAIENRLKTAFPANAVSPDPADTFDQAPATHPLEGMTFSLIDGGTLSYSQLKGKFVLVNFWAPWCPPCRAEIPDFIEVYNEWRQKGLEIIGIAEDAELEDTRKFVRSAEIPYPIVFQEKREWASALGFDEPGLPRSLLLAPDGRILIKRTGVLNSSTLLAALSKSSSS